MWYFRSLHAHLRRELERNLGQRAVHAEPPAVLDAGCGTGGFIRRLGAAHPDWRLSGLDVMPIACAAARARCRPEVEIREGSVTALPYDDGTFDAVTSADVLYQLDRPALALAEFYRVLRPGGVVVLNLPAYRWLWSYHDEAVHSRHRFVRREVNALLAEAGFDERWLSHWNALPLPLVWAKRKLFRTRHDTSDVKLSSPPVEAILNGVMAIEHAWIRAGGKWAWGVSILAVGRKRA